MKPTKNMKAFIEANSKSKIYQGALVAGGVEYCLESGRRFIISRADKESAPNYKPVWNL